MFMAVRPHVIGKALAKGGGFSIFSLQFSLHQGKFRRMGDPRDDELTVP